MPRACVACSGVKMVPKGGLEPPWVAPHAPQTCVSTNSTTSALAEKSTADERDSKTSVRSKEFLVRNSERRTPDSEPVSVLIRGKRGVLFLHRGLLRVHGGEPVFMTAVPSLHDVEKRGLQFLGDRAGLAG